MKYQIVIALNIDVPLIFRETINAFTQSELLKIQGIYSKLWEKQIHEHDL